MGETSIIIDRHSQASQLVVVYGGHIYTKFGLGLLQQLGPTGPIMQFKKASLDFLMARYNATWHGCLSLKWILNTTLDPNYIEVYYCSCLGKSLDKSSSKLLRHGGLRIQLVPNMVIRLGVLHKPVVPQWWTQPLWSRDKLDGQWVFKSWLEVCEHTISFIC